MGIIPPCKDCNKREMGCHSNCPDYAEFVKENEKRKAASIKDNENYTIRSAKTWSHSAITNLRKGGKK